MPATPSKQKLLKRHHVYQGRLAERRLHADNVPATGKVLDTVEAITQNHSEQEVETIIDCLIAYLEKREHWMLAAPPLF